MSEPKWTPGPWTAPVEEFDPGDNIAIEVEGAAIASVLGSDCFPCIEEDQVEEFHVRQMADAHLIAAAPELYTALRSLANEAQGFLAMADRETHGNTNIAVMRDKIRLAFDAVAKARGESK